MNSLLCFVLLHVYCFISDIVVFSPQVSDVKAEIEKTQGGSYPANGQVIIFQGKVRCRCCIPVGMRSVVQSERCSMHRLTFCARRC
jgi:hypothetical protein